MKELKGQKGKWKGIKSGEAITETIGEGKRKKNERCMKTDKGIKEMQKTGGRKLRRKREMSNKGKTIWEN